MKKVIINLGKGSLQHGCQTVVVQILATNKHCLRQCVGSLPPAPELAGCHQKWQNLYRAYHQDQATRINLSRTSGLRYSEQEFGGICRRLREQINEWLASESFAALERAIRTELSKNEAIQLIIATDDWQLRQLPWHLWNFFEDYVRAEVALSLLNWQKLDSATIRTGKVRILVVLGNSKDIDVQVDRQALETLSGAELVVLQEPQLSELNEYLWQKKGWDILLFSGHSQTEREEGRIYLNAKENLTISQLKNSLNRAIAHGLKIAIFNSCEGVGLAIELADLAIPYVVVMREQVPDRVAQGFLKYFLTAFVEGKTFTLSVREARQRLAGWESEFLCASWLPLIWQNPTTDSLTWFDLPGKRENLFSLSSNTNKSSKKWLLTSLLVSSLVMAMRSLALLEPLELWAYNRLMQQRPPETIDPRILVVEITEEDTNRYQYPLEDDTVVELLDKLERDRPLAIGLDLHRSHPRGEGYQALVERFEQNDNLFPVCAYGSSDDSYAPPRGMNREKQMYQMGFSDLLIDGKKLKTQSDRLDLTQASQLPTRELMVRRQLLSYAPNLAASPSNCITPYSFSFQLAYRYLQQQKIEPLTVNSQEQWQFGEVVFQELPSRFGAYQSLDGQSSQIAINYRSAAPGQTVTLAELLGDRVKPQLIQDRIILIGYTSPVARDYFETPIGAMAGVWIHAHMTSQMVSSVLDGRSLIWTLPQWRGIQWGDWLWVLGWTLLNGAVMVKLAPRSYIYLALANGVIIFCLYQACLLLLIEGGWMPYIPTTISLLLITSSLLFAETWLSTSKNVLYNQKKKP